MKKATSILWGIILVALGVIFGLNALEITNIDIFFDGWWTLLIIIPCVIGLFKSGNKTGNIAGIIAGVVLLLCCRGILDFDTVWKLIVPVLIITFGFKLIFGNKLGNKADMILKNMNANGKKPQSDFAIFSGHDISYDGEVFEGADLVSVFGNVQCDLRNAVFEKDCAIRVNTLFGGVDIFVPENVKVKVSTSSIFGGVDNKAKRTGDNAVTLYITGVCIFGGVDIQ